MGKEFKQASRGNYSNAVDVMTNEDIQTGCLQRIADATEKMSQDHMKLIENRDYWKQVADHRLSQIEKLKRSVTAYKASATRAKQRIRTN